MLMKQSASNRWSWNFLNSSVTHTYSTIYCHKNIDIKNSFNTSSSYEELKTILFLFRYKNVADTLKNILYIANCFLLFSVMYKYVCVKFY